MGVEDRGQIDVSAPSAEIDLTEEEALRGFWPDSCHLP